MFYAIILDANNNGTGSHAYGEQPASYPANEFPCTQAQAQNPSLWSLVSGALVQQLAPAQAAQIAIINTACQAALSAISAGYPPLELHTWSQQYAEAVAYTANSAATTPTLSAIAKASGISVSSLVSNVINKATAYQSASGAAIGKRIALTAEIMAATTVAAVQAIVW